MGTISTYGFLYPPFVALMLSDSVQGLRLTPANNDYAFGTVNAVNYNCIRTQVGKSVLFKKSEAILLTHEQDNYFVVDEKDLVFQEFIIM